MKEIQLTQGKVALVDDEDFDRVNQFKWHAHFDGWNWYADRALPRKDGKQGHLKLHQFLLPGRKRVDHKNGNGLDNQKHNLRPASHGQNIANSRKMRGCLSQFKGVTWCKRNVCWAVQIVFQGKNKHVGYFSDEKVAAAAYNSEAAKLWGEFARLNTI